MIRARAISASGFTLVEMLVALFVFALLAVAATAALTSGLSSQEVLKTREALMGRIHVARAILTADFGELAPRRVRGPEARKAFTGIAGGADLGEGTVLALVRTGWANPGDGEPRGGLQFVTYRIEGTRLLRRAYARVDAVADTPYAERVLLDGVSDVRFSFFDGVAWRDRWLSKDARPRAVALDLELDGVGPLRQLFLTPGGVE